MSDIFSLPEGFVLPGKREAHIGGLNSGVFGQQFFEIGFPVVAGADNIEDIKDAGKVDKQFVNVGVGGLQPGEPGVFGYFGWLCKNAVPKPAVMGADIADIAETMHPAFQHEGVPQSEMGRHGFLFRVNFQVFVNFGKQAH